MSAKRIAKPEAAGSFGSRNSPPHAMLNQAKVQKLLLTEGGIEYTTGNIFASHPTESAALLLAELGRSWSPSLSPTKWHSIYIFPNPYTLAGYPMQVLNNHVHPRGSPLEGTRSESPLQQQWSPNGLSNTSASSTSTLYRQLNATMQVSAPARSPVLISLISTFIPTSLTPYIVHPLLCDFFPSDPPDSGGKRMVYTPGHRAPLSLNCWWRCEALYLPTLKIHRM